MNLGALDEGAQSVVAVVVEREARLWAKLALGMDGLDPAVRRQIEKTGMGWRVLRVVPRSEAELVNAGLLASPNLYCSLDAEAKSILVRVFEKPCCQEEPGRSMMPIAKYEVRAVVGLDAGSHL